MTYRVLYGVQIRKDLERIPLAARRRVLLAVALLSEDPRPHGCKKLVGSELWRIRIGSYRAIYAIDEVRKLVHVEYVRHRKDAYR